MNHQDINTLLQEFWQNKEYSEARELISQEILTLEDLKKDDYLLAANISWFSPLNSPETKTSKIIAIYANTLLEPDKVLDGRNGAGSEYALVMLAQELTKLGYHVYVFCHINPDQNVDYCRTGAQPQYLPIYRSYRSQVTGASIPTFINCWDQVITLPANIKRIDELIVWRTTFDKSYDFSNYADRCHLWSHDVPTQYLNYEPDIIYTLSNWHKSLFEEKFGNKFKIVVGCNGITPGPKVKLNREPEFSTRCIYASNYTRGLEQLLTIWPQIKEAVPTASLDIYYGRETYTNTNIDHIVKLIEDSKDLDVTERGRVDHTTLRKEMSRAGFLLYPYQGSSETFCINVATASCVGCLPIVCKRDGLIDTLAVQEQDLIDLDEYTVRCIELLQDSEIANHLREVYAEHCAQYTWKQSAQIWHDIFQNLD